MPLRMAWLPMALRFERNIAAATNSYSIFTTKNMG
jgi:hypothetical protein